MSDQPVSVGSAWRPAPFIWLSGLGHGVALVWLVLVPQQWGWILTGLVLNHVVLASAGLWPRSTLLGVNRVRLSAEAIARGEIALTFDDGPDPTVTPQVLAILAQYGVQATFFCIGERVVKYPALCRSIIAAGHSIQNHGQLHRWYTSLYGWSGWWQEVAGGQLAIEAITGQRPTYYRAMAGLRNPLLDPVLHRLGIELVSWTRRGFDTRNGNGDAVLARLTHHLRAGDILLLHDGHAAHTPSGEWMVLEVLPRLLDECRVRQLKPVVLTV